MRLIVTRHGETVENRKGVIQGHLHGRLSKKGIDQARRLAERLSGEDIDVIYSSDLARAADTAREIARHHPEADLVLTEELRERHIGNLQGRIKEEIGWKDKKANYYEPDSTLDGVESIRQLFERAGAFLHRIIGVHASDTVLMVCHAGIAKAIICVITGVRPEEMHKTPKLGNTSLNIIEVDEDRNHRIILHDCTRHLD